MVLLCFSTLTGFTQKQRGVYMSCIEPMIVEYNNGDTTLFHNITTSIKKGNFDYVNMYEIHKILNPYRESPIKNPEPALNHFYKVLKDWKPSLKFGMVINPQIDHIEDWLTKENPTEEFDWLPCNNSSNEHFKIDYLSVEDEYWTYEVEKLQAALDQYSGAYHSQEAIDNGIFNPLDLIFKQHLDFLTFLKQFSESAGVCELKVEVESRPGSLNLNSLDTDQQIFHYPDSSFFYLPKGYSSSFHLQEEADAVEELVDRVLVVMYSNHYDNILEGEKWHNRLSLYHYNESQKEIWPLFHAGKTDMPRYDCYSEETSTWTSAGFHLEINGSHNPNGTYINEIENHVTNQLLSKLKKQSNSFTNKNLRKSILKNQGKYMWYNLEHIRALKMYPNEDDSGLKSTNKLELASANSHSIQFQKYMQTQGCFTIEVFNEFGKSFQKEVVCDDYINIYLEEPQTRLFFIKTTHQESGKHQTFKINP